MLKGLLCLIVEPDDGSNVSPTPRPHQVPDWMSGESQGQRLSKRHMEFICRYTQSENTTAAYWPERSEATRVKAKVTTFLQNQNSR